MSPITSQRPKRFKDFLVRPGDVVLTTTPQKVSKAIRNATGSDISHAMLCVADSSVIDSTDEGAQARNLRRVVIEPGCAAYVLRATKALTPQQLNAIIGFARSMVGTRYTKIGAVKAVLKAGAVGRRQFCSRLVAQAYREAGIHVVADADFCHPGELLQSDLLVEVEDVLMDLSPEEEAAWKESADLTQLMRDTSNGLLEDARKVSSGIESLNDIDDYLIAHPEADARLSEGLKASGYLDAWRPEFERNRWQYDSALMEKQPVPRELMREYCVRLLMDEELGENRFVTCRGEYVARHATTGLHYFALMTELYTLLSEHHAQRVRTATTWLKRRGSLTPVSVKLLRPNTPEWLASMRAWNPVQAAMTEAVIEQAGGPDVCSVCGDDPASDYVQVEQAPAGPGTIRLCDDCHRIRSPSEPMMAFPEYGDAA